jgi:hypothetical protein
MSYALHVTRNNEDDFYAYFHSIMNSGLIFWQNSPHGAKVLK